MIGIQVGKLAQSGLELVELLLLAAAVFSGFSLLSVFLAFSLGLPGGTARVLERWSVE